MADFNSVEEILDFAIEREVEAQEFYLELAGMMEKPWMKEVFEEFVEEEKRHEAALIQIKEGGRPLKPAGKQVQDLKLAEYLVDQQPDEQMDYQSALIVAMKREKAAFKLYSDLAEMTDDADLAKTLRAMAQEEAKHKLRFEIEYDDTYREEKF